MTTRVKKEDCVEALALLREYHGKLTDDQPDLKRALDKVINVFNSNLFSALVDIQDYYSEILQEVHKSPEQVSKEATMLAKRWESSKSDEIKSQPDNTSSHV
ncbi:disks large 1 tumor suppressor protein-like [Hydractinia symbiolongicarpus]|uniref:disks large 1 tumor suppressor protein-like n=1 Tax=Hydractinia symbiolongicarpus TaxID=13093 RepID=UPI00255044A3|nr:disks large 1 tumor suppressor protein-like [Hydractinia symbiolongicarpus]